MSSNDKIHIVTGPTAVGKSDFAIRLANELDGEVISADSMQVYRFMDIGTAKVMMHERGGVAHHLIDIIDPDESFSVAIFARLARAAISDVAARGKMPIICGGAGFYINALLYAADMDCDTSADEGYRDELYALAKRDGNFVLHNMLQQIDAESAAAIPANNVKRVVRALEFYKLNGRPISAHNRAQRAKGAAFNAEMHIMTEDRARLYTRIDARVDKMITSGLVEEVESLLSRGYAPSLVSMQGIGYKEVAAYLLGKVDKETAILKVKQNSRRYAKRQLTWIRNQAR